MIDKIRLRVRLTTNALDAEIADLIEEAKADLILSGISESKIVDEDPLILRAVTAYCRAYYASQKDEADNAARLSESYESIKKHLALSGDYRGAGP